MQIIQVKETPQHKKSSHTARTRRRAEQRTQPLTFVCVDGEGVTDENGNHRYVLIGVGENQISDPNGLSWSRIFEFLYGEFTTGSVAYTGFFLGYDFTQWVRTLPEYNARRLLDKKERAKRKRRTGHNGESLAGQEIYFPVDLDGWEFDILGTKRFKLRPKGESRWMYICDTGGFFQKAFLKVIDPREWKEPIVTDEEYATILRGKEQRSTAALDSDMAKYNRLENEVLSRVLMQLDTGFRELGIHLSPKQWFGPGQAAQAWLDGRAITSKDLQRIVPPWFLEAAIASYYGGWFEIMAHGLIPGITYEYDINSAYPYIISRLPCLEHGTYTRHTLQRDIRAIRSMADAGMETGLRLVRVRAWGKGCRISQEVPDNTNHHVGPLPHRDRDGNISRPLITEGWYWQHEIDAAVRAQIISEYEIREILSYDRCDCPAPFSEVQEIYNLRLRVGKKTPLGMACKLMPNSLYGKFAQSIGNPKFGNPIYASLITSWCRTIILNAIATHPKGKSDVVMVATDGVYFRTPHPNLTISTNLGEWDSGLRQNICLFKPGVYWDDTTRESIRLGEAPIFKTRGVSARDFASQIETIDSAFAGMRSTRNLTAWPEVEFDLSFAMVSAVQALARRKWNTAGTLLADPTAKQSSNPSKKRSAWYWDDDILRSKPPVNYPFEPSHPYTKRFGLDDPWSIESISESGETPEGYVSEIWKQILFPDLSTLRVSALE